MGPGSLGTPFHWAVRSKTGESQHPGVESGRVERFGIVYECGKGFCFERNGRLGRCWKHLDSVGETESIQKEKLEMQEEGDGK